jgi:hypothetical protein
VAHLSNIKATSHDWIARVFNPELRTRFSQFPSHTWITQGAERRPSNPCCVLDYIVNGAYLERDADGIQFIHCSHISSNLGLTIIKKYDYMYHPLGATVPGIESDSYCPQAGQPDRRARATRKCHLLFSLYPNQVTASPESCLFSSQTWVTIIASQTLLTCPTHQFMSIHRLA